MSAAEDVRRLQERVDRGKAADAHARSTDAARHLRLACELLEGCLEPTPKLTRVAELLVEAADLLTEEG